MEETVSGSIETIVPASSSPADKVEALRRVHVFADLPHDQLQWFAEHAQDHRYSTGDVVFRKGDKPEWMVIYLEGEIHAYWDESDHDQIYIGRAGVARIVRKHRGNVRFESRPGDTCFQVRLPVGS